MVVAKSSLRRTNEDDEDNIYRLQTALGVTGERFLIRGGNRNFKVVNIDNNKANNIKNDGQQYRAMERKGSNIFLHEGM